MKKLLLVFTVLSLVTFACGDDASRKKIGSSKDRMKATATVSGEKIYKKNCVICHGTRGDMGASGAHDLTASVLPLAERVQIVTKGRNTMVGFENILKEEEIKAVAEYSLTLNSDL